MSLVKINIHISFSNHTVNDKNLKGYSLDKLLNAKFLFLFLFKNIFKSKFLLGRLGGSVS